MSYELKGKMYRIFPVESKTDTFQTREFVIETKENYPQLVKFQLTQDRCEILNDYNEGEEVNVHFDLRGREWNEKFFTNLQAWKLEKSATDQTEPTNDLPPDGFDDFSDEDQSDLPF